MRAIFTLPDHEIDRFGLDDGLDERFRLDSLGRAELMLRLERLFDVRLPDALRASARTPRDILEALSKAEARVAVRSVSVVAPPTAGPSEIKPVPKSIKNLPDGLARYEKHQPDRPP